MIATISHYWHFHACYQVPRSGPEHQTTKNHDFNTHGLIGSLSRKGKCIYSICIITFPSWKSHRCLWWTKRCREWRKWDGGMCGGRGQLKLRNSCTNQLTSHLRYLSIKNMWKGCQGEVWDCWCYLCVPLSLRICFTWTNIEIILTMQMENQCEELQREQACVLLYVHTCKM